MRCLARSTLTALLNLLVAAVIAPAAWGAQAHNPKATEHFQQGTRLADHGDHAGAIKEFEEAVRLEPGWLALHNDLGVELYLTGNPAAAVRELRTASDLDPSQGAVRVNLGFALYDLGKLDEAVTAWREALDRGATVADAYAGLALGLYKQGHADEAFQMYRKAIATDSAYARVAHLGAEGAGWSPHAVSDAAQLLQALDAAQSNTPHTAD